MGINTKGNTKNVLKTPLKKRPDFPALSHGSAGRIATKHFMNLLSWLNNEALSLLGFLVYQADVDNTIKYTTKLLQHYDAYMNHVTRYGKKRIKSSLPNSRQTFKYLIEQGILLQTAEEKLFMINPNLIYSEHAIKIKFYDSWTMCYRHGDDLKELTTMYINHVRKQA